MTETQISPADSALPGWLSSLPEGLRPYAMLARWDRPVGVWLLYLPCLIGLAFERIRTGLYLTDSCLLYTSPSPRDLSTSRMPSSA